MKSTLSDYPPHNRRAGRKTGFWLLGVVALAGTASSLAQTASLTTDHFSYLPGEPITASFQGGPANPKDWVGVYPLGTAPGSVGSTIWLYTDGTTTGTVGLSEGSVTFASGLSLAGDWTAYLLANDGYSKLAQTDLRVIDPSQPFVRTDKRSYSPGQAISVMFTNGYGNAKDWIGIYPDNRLPGDGDSLVWDYVDGTQNGETGPTEGLLTFAAGLPSSGNYVAYLLENDGYNVIASEPFSVVLPSSPVPRVISLTPINNASNVGPFVEISATIKDGTLKLATNSVALLLDGTSLAYTLIQQSNLTMITYTNPVDLPPQSAHALLVRFSDNAATPNWYTNQTAFTVATYVDLHLPSPLYFEDFESTAEGNLPAGWTSTSYSDVTDTNFDLQDLNSMSYANWVVVSRDRFTNDFLSYTAHTPTDDYRRVLSVNPLNVVNGKPVRGLAAGHFVFGDSGYRDGGNQYLILQTPDFDLRGKTNVYLSFHSLWEQNQDSIGAVEYSLDQGTNWLPIVYMLATSDVLTNATGTVDAVATFTTQYSDVAVYTDPVTYEVFGGDYAAFIGAPITPDLAPYISPRIDDDPVESKRVEFFRLPQADNQATVRVRFAHAGTDSWYFGIDNFGLYSLANAAQPVALSFARDGNGLAISWPIAAAGFMLESTDSLSHPQWSPVSGVTNNSVHLTIGAGQEFYRLRQ